LLLPLLFEAELPAKQYNLDCKNVIQRIIYHVLKNYCRFALRFYFRQWQIHKYAPIADGPVIFVANHQNAFLDAILMICSSHRKPWALTRSGVFEKPLVRKFLTTIHMLPVYRFRDGFSTLRKNDEMIETCANLLHTGKCLLVFGEGNHNDQWSLRSLQKGFARIALAAEEKNNWKLGVKIVPVGLQYDSHEKFRSRVLVSFGAPLLVNQIANPSKTLLENIDSLIKTTADSFDPLILHINPDQYEKRLAYFQANRVIKKDLLEQLKSDQKVVDQANPEIEVIAKPSGKNIKWLSPIYLYQYVNHIFPTLIVHWILRTKVKDPQFIGSLKFASGLVLIPFFYTVQTCICFLLSGSAAISTLYFISLPLSIALRRS
jgi:1-acyl-sn-glycerol-3-phosphate acyltransferase